MEKALKLRYQNQEFSDIPSLLQAVYQYDFSLRCSLKQEFVRVKPQRYIGQTSILLNNNQD